MTDVAPTAVWLEQNNIGGPVDYHTYGALLARRQAEAAERAQEVAEARRQAQLEEERDQRLTVQRLAGVQPGQVMQRALQLQDLETEIATRQAEIDKLSRRRDRLVAEGQEQAGAVSRSVAMLGHESPVNPVQAAVQRSREALAEHEAGLRVNAMLAGRRGGRERAMRRAASLPKAGPHDPAGCQICVDYAEGSRPDHDQPSVREISR